MLSRTAISRANACRLIRSSGDKLESLLHDASLVCDSRTRRVVFITPQMAWPESETSAFEQRPRLVANPDYIRGPGWRLENIRRQALAWMAHPEQEAA